MSVRNFLRRQTDVNQPSSSRSHQNQSVSELERPLSEYDNITTTVAPTAAQTHFPLRDIKFRFDDLPLTTTTIMNNSSHSSAVQCNNNNNSNGNDKQTTTLPAAHQYENVLDTLQMRSKRESDQQVKMNQNEQSPQQRSVMSDAKSSFFGLNNRQAQSSTQDEFDRLIADISNTQVLASDRSQYVNLMPRGEEEKSSTEKVSPTSSASGSSSTTATPSSSPTRQDRTGSSRKNSAASTRSKSPKFMLPEMTSPSQVKRFP